MTFMHVFSFTLHVHQKAHAPKPQQGSEGREAIQTETRSQQTLLTDQLQTLREVCTCIFLSNLNFQEFHYELCVYIRRFQN